MAGKRKKESVLERTAQVFDLPGDLVAGLPRMELVGDRELRMENHRGILAYGSEEIHISGGKLILKVRGEGLELRSMERRRTAHHRTDPRRGAGLGGRR